MRTHCGIRSEAGRQHLPVGGPKSPTQFKSNSSNSLLCLCLTVNLGVWGPWGLSLPSCNWTSLGGSGTGSTALPWPQGFSCGGSVSKPCCPYHHNCLFTSLPQFCVCVLYTEALWQRAISSPQGLYHDVHMFSSIGPSHIHQHHVGREGLYGLHILGEHYWSIASGLGSSIMPSPTSMVMILCTDKR